MQLTPTVIFRIHAKVDLTRGSQGTVGVIFVTFLMEVGGRAIVLLRSLEIEG